MVTKLKTAQSTLSASYLPVMEKVATDWFQTHPHEPMPMSQLFERTSDELKKKGLLPGQSWVVVSREELVRSLLTLMNEQILRWNDSLQIVPVGATEGEKD